MKPEAIAVKDPATGLPKFEECMRRLGYKSYPEQVRVSRHLSSTRDSEKVGFIEAPTATGKTFVIAHHVLEHVAVTAQPYVIAVPTIELGHQTLAAVQRMQSASKAFERIITRIVLGRQEFVSPIALDDLITALRDDKKGEVADAISAWVADGAPGRSLDHPAWTLDGLERWLDANGISAPLGTGLALGQPNDDCDASKAYQGQFSEGVEIYIVTHAMLARDHINRFVATSRERRKQGMQTAAGLSHAERWLEANDQRLQVETGDEGKLPDYRRLIIDEAHLFRANFEAATRTGISISSLLRNLEAINAVNNKAVSTSALRAVRQIRKSLGNLPNAQAGNRVQIDWTEEDPFTTSIERLSDALDRVKPSKIPDTMDREKFAVEQAKYALREALNARAAISTVFEWSPVVSFPTITVGRRNLTPQLMMMWARLDSAALISATLFTENVAGPSIEHTANRLSVPENLRKTPRPIVADWLHKPVTVLMPTEGHANLIRTEDPDERKAWLDAVAEQIVLLSANSRGCLVLNTRRADSHDLAERLRHLVGASRIIDGSTGRASAFKQIFIQMARDNAAPIWLAQGPAWTGLDLPDDVLDTLAITRMPFPMPDASGVNGNKIGYYGASKISEMAMTFKQGLGRLVRTRNAGPKTFAMLDGRILKQKNASGIRKLLGNYRQKTLPKSTIKAIKPKR